MPENPRLRLEPKTRLSTGLAIRFSNVLQMSEEDASRLTSILESDPLFERLFRPKDPNLKVFSRQGLPGTRLSPSFYEVRDTAQAPGGPEIESILFLHKDLIEKIKGIGAARFERYFLYEGSEQSLETIAEELGIGLELAGAIRSLTDKVLMNSDIFSARLPGALHPPESRFTRLAQYAGVERGEWEIRFLSPAMARGIYRIDYEKLKIIKKSELFNEKERKSLQSLIRILEMVNSRRSLIYRILKLIPRWQAEFFQKRDWDRLVSFKQKTAAREVGVTPAAVCRAVQGRSVLISDGEEVPLRDFFPSEKDIRKRRIAGFLRDNNEKRDRDLREILQARFGIQLSRRSVNVYRNEILGKKK